MVSAYAEAGGDVDLKCRPIGAESNSEWTWQSRACSHVLLSRAHLNSPTVCHPAGRVPQCASSALPARNIAVGTTITGGGDLCHKTRHSIPISLLHAAHSPIPVPARACAHPTGLPAGTERLFISAYDEAFAESAGQKNEGVFCMVENASTPPKPVKFEMDVLFVGTTPVLKHDEQEALKTIYDK